MSSAATFTRSVNPNRPSAHRAGQRSAFVGAVTSQERSEMKKRSDYTPAQWAQLYPEERHAIDEAANDIALGRGSSTIHVRAAEGRGVVIIDRATGQPVASAPPRRIGGLT